MSRSVASGTSVIPVVFAGILTRRSEPRTPLTMLLIRVIGATLTVSAIQGFVPINLGFNNSTIPNQSVSRTGYEEKYVVDYNAYSLKLNGAVHYKITNNTEASLVGYWGTGTTVYTGADRYAIKNFKMGQYKLEFKGRNWFLRGYTIQENGGDSYTATTAAIFINRAWKSDANWLTTYAASYSEARRTLGYSDIQAHAAARAAADA